MQAIKMDFYALYKKINPRLKWVAKRYNGHGLFIDENDLYQEMCMHLWSKYGGGVPHHVNESYIIKGCEFHILNYLRIQREKATLVSIEQPINEAGDTIQDMLPDTRRPFDEIVDRDIKINCVRDNGFSEKEKDVFTLLSEGRTIREVGRELAISHVMVLKYKKNLIKKLKGRLPK